MNHQTNQINTDRAWNLLYARLEENGLIPEDVNRKPSGRLYRRLSPSGWVAAALLILCTGVAALRLLQKNGGETDALFLTLHNEKGAVTLVTTLEDGSIVYLADDTRLYYPEHFMPDKREVSLRGEAMFDVKGNRERPFLITTGTVRIEVTGTAFNVQSTDNKSLELSVRQGEVKVIVIENGQYLYAKAKETVRLTSTGGLHLEQSPDTDPFNRYTGRIRFKDEKLSDILEVINRKGGDLILRTTPALENRKITVTFANDTPENVAALICLAFNLICKRENNILLISEP
jgi:ferric-dicitrate binding protein FerR (iron transport regulator)